MALSHALLPAHTLQQLNKPPHTLGPSLAHKRVFCLPEAPARAAPVWPVRVWGAPVPPRRSSSAPCSRRQRAARPRNLGKVPSLLPRAGRAPQGPEQSKHLLLIPSSRGCSGLSEMKSVPGGLCLAALRLGLGQGAGFLCHPFTPGQSNPRFLGQASPFSPWAQPRPRVLSRMRCTSRDGAACSALSGIRRKPAASHGQGEVDQGRRKPQETGKMEDYCGVFWGSFEIPPSSLARTQKGTEQSRQ